MKKLKSNEYVEIDLKTCKFTGLACSCLNKQGGPIVAGPILFEFAGVGCNCFEINRGVPAWPAL